MCSLWVDYDVPDEFDFKRHQSPKLMELWQISYHVSANPLTDPMVQTHGKDLTTEALQHATAAVGGARVTGFTPSVLQSLFELAAREVRAGRLDLGAIDQIAKKAITGPTRALHEEAWEEAAPVPVHVVVLPP